MSDKGKIGGKYERITATGYYGRNDAGNKMEFVPKDAGDKVGFKGSRSNEYTFSDIEHGTHTFVASKLEDALRMAEAMGYTREDYKPRKDYKRRRRGR